MPRTRGFPACVLARVTRSHTVRASPRASFYISHGWTCPDVDEHRANERGREREKKTPFNPSLYLSLSLFSILFSSLLFLRPTLLSDTRIKHVKNRNFGWSFLAPLSPLRYSRTLSFSLPSLLFCLSSPVCRVCLSPNWRATASSRSQPPRYKHGFNRELVSPQWRSSSAWSGSSVAR